MFVKMMMLMMMMMMIIRVCLLLHYQVTTTWGAPTNADGLFAISLYCAAYTTALGRLNIICKFHYLWGPC